jgi:hypothetical protein
MAMYNSDKDVIVKKFKQKTWGLTRLQIEAHSYNEGPAKIQITRLRRNSEEESEEWKFNKLGRLSLEEVAWITKIFKREVLPWAAENQEEEE